MAYLDADRVAAQFPDDPYVRSGHVPMDALSPLQTLAFLSLSGTMKRYGRHLKRSVIDLYLAQSSEPAINVRAARKPGLGVSIVTIGLLNLIGALAARMTVLTMRGNTFPFLELSTGGGSVGSWSGRSLTEFELSQAKRRATGLTRESIEEEVSAFSDDQQLAFLEIYCAALEFMVLHESYHVVLRHREARKLFDGLQHFTAAFDAAGLMNWDDKPGGERFTPAVRIERCFEHQADYFALKSMVLVAPRRPVLSGELEQRWARHVIDRRNSRRYLAVIGAGIAFAAITLMQADEPDGPLIPRNRASSHPVPLYRLKVACNLLCSGMSNPFGRLVSWPSMVFADYGGRIMTAEWVTMMAATAILSPDYVREFARPAEEWADWRRRLHLEHDESAFLWKGFDDDMQRARDLIAQVKNMWIPDDDAGASD